MLGLMVLTPLGFVKPPLGGSITLEKPINPASWALHSCPFNRGIKKKKKKSPRDKERSQETKFSNLLPSREKSVGPDELYSLKNQQPKPPTLMNHVLKNSISILPRLYRSALRSASNSVSPCGLLQSVSS